MSFLGKWRNYYNVSLRGRFLPEAILMFKDCFVALLLAMTLCEISFAAELPLQLIKLPPGFEISIFADNIPNARSLTRGEKGTIFVGNRSQDKVWAIVDKDNDGKVDEKYVIAEKLTSPNGVAFKDGSLYVAEMSRVIRFDDIENQLANPPSFVVVNDSFPNNPWHGWKFIAFGPDGKLYVPVGAPCNVCERDYNQYENIMRMNADGTGLETFAKGVRNSVGFDWDPETKELWFTDNGRDELGDDIPSDELNHAPKIGMHFGFPYCHEGTIPDPEYGKKHACNEFTRPAQKLGPHVAALGMRFYTGTMFPEEYRNQIFIAQHGSWNRSSKIGYRIMLVKLKDNAPVSYEVFAEGWKVGERAWGRPVDVLNLPDGSILISDDQAGVVYRITYSEKR
jgi:glucose/arabinose dehydrogenase